jgi:hypothetical protein
VLLVIPLAQTVVANRALKWLPSTHAQTLGEQVMEVTSSFGSGWLLVGVDRTQLGLNQA